MRISSWKRKILIIVILALAVSIIGLYQKAVKNWAFRSFAGWQQVLWHAGEEVSNFSSGLLRSGEIREELNESALKNQELLSRIARLEEMEEENRQLREALGLGLEKEFQMELANIVSKDISRDSILVDKGEEDEIAEGNAVITPAKILVGRIGQVYKDFSEVILISSDESSFEAKISGREVFGVARGKGSMKVSLELIPKEETVSEGDLVVSSSLGGVFPQGLLVGEIKGVKRSDVEPFQTAEINTGFTVGDLDRLIVITGF